mgnify:CR=1 FL=1
MSGRRGRKKGAGRTKIEVERYLISSDVPEEVFFKLNEILYDQTPLAFRKNPRIPVNLPLVWKFGEEVMMGSTYTLSREGMFIKTMTPAGADSEIEISFFLPDDDEPIRVSAKVARKIDPGEARSQGLISGMAVTFKKVDEEAQRRLDHFIHKKMKKRPSPKWI